MFSERMLQAALLQQITAWNRTQVLSSEALMQSKVVFNRMSFLPPLSSSLEISNETTLNPISLRGTQLFWKKIEIVKTRRYIYEERQDYIDM